MSLYQYGKISNFLIFQEEEEGLDNEQVADKHSKGSSDGDATTGSYSSLEDDEAEIDQLTALAAKYQIDNMDLGNGNKICMFFSEFLYCGIGRFATYSYVIITNARFSFR